LPEVRWIGMLGIADTLTVIIGKCWPLPEGRPVVEVHDFVAINEKRVTRFDREIVDANLPRLTTDRSLEYDMIFAGSSSPASLHT